MPRLPVLGLVLAAAAEEVPFVVVLAVLLALDGRDFVLLAARVRPVVAVAGLVVDLGWLFLALVVARAGAVLALRVFCARAEVDAGWSPATCRGRRPLGPEVRGCFWEPRVAA